MTTRKERRQQRYKDGICRDCSRPRLGIFTLCPICHGKMLAGAKRYYQENKEMVKAKQLKTKKERMENGQCRECGNDLDSDADKGNVTCVNCITRRREA